MTLSAERRAWIRSLIGKSASNRPISYERALSDLWAELARVEEERDALEELRSLAMQASVYLMALSREYDGYAEAGKEVLADEIAEAGKLADEIHEWAGWLRRLPGGRDAE